MRVLIAVLVLVSLIIIDQTRFRGHYGTQFSQFIARIVHAMK